jgi:hypothetical protein
MTQSMQEILVFSYVTIFFTAITVSATFLMLYRLYKKLDKVLDFNAPDIEEQEEITTYERNVTPDPKEPPVLKHEP